MKASNGLLRQHEARFLMRLLSARSYLHGAKAGTCCDSTASIVKSSHVRSNPPPVLQAERRPTLGVITAMSRPTSSVARARAGHAAAAGPIAHRGIAAALKGRGDQQKLAR